MTTTACDDQFAPDPLCAHIDHLARLKAEWDEKELAPIWETLIKVGDILGIDPEAARKVPGKPSEVYADHLARLKAEWQAEVLEEYREELGAAGVAFVDCLTKQLRCQAEEPTDCPGTGKCDDPGCPAHYAMGGENK